MHALIHFGECANPFWRMRLSISANVFFYLMSSCTNMWQFTFCWWPKPDVFIFFYTSLAYAFSIMKSMDKYDSYNSYDRSNVEIWMKYYEVCLILSFHYPKSLNTACFKKKKCSGTLLFTEKVTFEMILIKFLYHSIWSNMTYNLFLWCLKPIPCILSL